MTEERTLRLFFALWPDEAMQTELDHAARKAIRTSGGRPIPPRNFHFTLAFLGSVAESRLSALESIAVRVASGTREIHLTLDQLEYWKKPQLLCGSARETPREAIALASNLKRELTAAGFSPDLKPFRAHVTLARKVSRLTRDLDMHSVQWRFTALSLVASETRPEGSLYSVVKSWTLCAPNAAPNV